MRLLGDGGGLELRTKKEVLRSPGCKKVILLKHGDRIPGQEGLPRSSKESLITYSGVGGGKVKRKFPKGF